jgi:hypothetical protein
MAATAFCMELYRTGKLIPEKQEKEKRLVVPTFAEFSQGWWDYETCPYLKKRKGRRKIAKGYATQGQYAVKNHLIPDFGKKRLDAISAFEIDTWLSSFPDQGYANNTGNLTGEPLVKPELYASMVLNPADNREHLPEDYISDILDVLPERQRARFRDGAWVKAEGVVYDKFDEGMIVRPADLPERFDRFAAGQDFGLNITNVKIGLRGDCVYVLADYGSYNMTTQSFNEELLARKWFSWQGEGGAVIPVDFPIYCDPAGGERIQEITNGVKANNSVEAGIDYINAKIERGQFFVSAACAGVLSEIWDYCRDEAGEIVKVNDHFMDALRYAVFSDVQQGVIAV